MRTLIPHVSRTCLWLGEADLFSVGITCLNATALLNSVSHNSE